MIPPRNRQTTITDEKYSAKCLKHGTTRYRRQKHILRSAPVRHWMSNVVSSALLVRCIIRLPQIRKDFSRSRGTNDLRKTDESSQHAAVILLLHLKECPRRYSSAVCDVEQSGRRWQDILSYPEHTALQKAACEEC